MLPIKIERGSAPLWLRVLLPFIAIALTFVLVSILILIADAEPEDTFYELLINPLTKRTARLDILTKAAPLLLTGTAVAFAFSAGYYNIGAEGQLYAGAVAAAWLGPRLDDVPQVISIVLMLLIGFAAGALWALPPALLKVKLKVDEVVTTLLLNSVMLFLVSALLNGVWRDPVSGWPQSPEIALSAQFPRLFERSRAHLGVVVAIGAILVFWWFMRYTRLGLELRAAGMGSPAARFMGVQVKRSVLTAALISGGIAGLAGVGEVAGLQYHLTDAISPGYGYSGIIVATFGGLSAVGVGLAGFFLALIDIGSLSASRVVGVPSYLGDVIQSVLLLTTLAMLLLTNYRVRRK
jgi:simple sugar transport system permease protein